MSTPQSPSDEELRELLRKYQACSDRGHPTSDCRCKEVGAIHWHGLASEVLMLRQVVKDYGKQIIGARRGNEQAEHVAGQQLAYAVWMPKGSEFDYKVFPDRQSAEDECSEDESGEMKVVPLYSMPTIKSALEGK